MLETSEPNIRKQGSLPLLMGGGSGAVPHLYLIGHRPVVAQSKFCYLSFEITECSYQQNGAWFVSYSKLQAIFQFFPWNSIFINDLRLFQWGLKARCRFEERET